MKTIKGPAIFLAQFVGDAAPFNSLDCDLRLGGVARLQGRADPDLGRAAVRPGEGGREQGPTATRSRARSAEHGVADHRAQHAPAGPAGRGPSGLRRGLRRLRGARGARQPEGAPGMGGAADAVRRAKASRNLGLDAHVTFSGALAYPYLYPWPPRPKGLIDTAFDELAKRWRPILDAYRRAGRRRLLRDPSGRGPARRRLVRALPGQGRRPSALLHQLRPVALRACRRSTICSSSTSTTSGSRRSTSRTPSSIPTAGRASFPASRTGRPGRALPLAGRRAGRLRRHLQQAHHLRLRLLGGARMGVLPQEPRGRRARGGRVHRRRTSSR